MSFFKKAALGTALVATAVTTASPAMADPYYGRHNRGGDSTGAAIVGGIVGLALGALIVSSTNNNHRDRYAERGWQYRDGYYWDREGRRYDRNGRHHPRNGYYARRGYEDRYEGYRQNDRGYYGRDDYYGDRTYRRGY
ncbi:MAG: hypothetical protein V4579_13560 [Pseudomonadota bacterium]